MRNNFKELSDELKPREKMRRAPTVRTVDDASLLAVMLKTGARGCDVAEASRRLIEASLVVGIPLIDHIVLGNPGFVSLRDSGLVAF